MFNSPAQQEKLAIILKHYTDRQSTPETHDTPSILPDQGENLQLFSTNPLESYGKEVRKSFEVFISKILKLQEENQEVLMQGYFHPNLELD